MIENTTTITLEDMQYIIKKSKFHPKQRKRNVMLTVITVLCFGWFAVVAVLSAMSGRLSWIMVLCMGLMLGLGSYALLSLLIPEKLFAKKTMNQPAYKSPRHIVFDENGVDIEADRGGMETKLHIGYDHMEGYWLTDGVVYIRLITEEKMLVYVTVHDDGYTQGDRNALTTLLESHGVKQLAG